MPDAGPAGAEGPPPDFIIGGAPRSGTTWLYQVLDRHPGLYLAKPRHPEPKFFLIDEEYEKGLQYYRDNWFRDVPETLQRGEKSTNYLESNVAAHRIHRHLPDVKLIFVLREPASRALSNWRWSRMNGLEDLSFEEALRAESRREATYPPDLRFSRPHSYYSRGLYRELLQPYVDLFTLQRILCLRYEDLNTEPGSLAARVHSFLEVARRPQDGEAVGVVNPSASDSAGAETCAALRDRYTEPNRELTDLLGAEFEIWERDNDG